MRGDEASTLRALHEVATDIRDLDSRAAVCRRAVEAAEEVLAFDHCAVALERDGRLRIVASAGDVDADSAGPLSADEGLAGRAYRTGESTLTNVGAGSAVADGRDRFDAALTVPIDGHGVLQAVRASTDPFDEDDRDFGELLCGHVSQALDRIDRERKLEARNETLARSERRTRQVQSVTEDLIDADSRRAVASHIVDAARDVFTLPLSGVHLRDESRDALEGVAATDEVERELGEVPDYECDGGPAQRVVWDAYESGEPLIVDDAASDDRIPVEGLPVESLIIHPLGDHGVYILSSPDSNDFDRTDVALADLLASMATAAMDQAVHRRELEQYETIVETVPDGVFLLDETGTIRQVNEAWADVVGYDPDALVGEPFQVLIDDGVVGDHVVDEYLETVRRLLSSETDQRSASFVSELRSSDGPDRTYEVHIRLLPYDDSFRGVAGVVRDVTERMTRKRELERENERLDEFASVVSHDLRNPLGVAKASLDLAAETGEEAHFDRCGRALDRMDTLIEDLLALSQAGETVGEVSAVALDETAAQAWAVVETGEATLSVESPSPLCADRGRLQQLLENLFRNAVEHGSTEPPSRAPEDAVEHGTTDPRSGSREDAVERETADVRVTVGTFDDGFYVADDGPGVPEDAREDLFERGYSTTDSGTGFGLAIVERIATAHGWTVGVTESAAGGARFEVTGVEFADDAQ